MARKTFVFRSEPQGAAFRDLPQLCQPALPIILPGMDRGRAFEAKAEPRGQRATAFPH